MRDGLVAGALAFAAVLLIAAWTRPVPPTPTPSPGALPTLAGTGVVVTCAVPAAECAKLAALFAERARKSFPNSVIVSLEVRAADTFQACFLDGTCVLEVSGDDVEGRGGIGPAETPGPLP